MGKKWPDLRLLDAAIAFMEVDGDKYRGVAVMISNTQTRKSGMALLRDGFLLERTNGSSSLYCNRNLSKFSVSDVKRWFPQFDPELMMGIVDKIPLVDDIHALMPVDDIDDVMEQVMIPSANSTECHSTVTLGTMFDAATSQRFGVMSTGVIWISEPACEKQGYPTQEEYLAALRDFDLKQYGQPVSHRLSPVDAKINVDMIIKQGKDANSVADLFRWAAYKFSGNEHDAIEKLIKEFKKSKASHLLEDPIVQRCLKSLKRFTSSENITTTAFKGQSNLPDEQTQTLQLF